MEDKFKTWLKHARENAGLTKAALGRNIGVSDAAIGMYESGAKRPRLDIKNKIFEVFGKPEWAGDNAGDEISHVSDELAPKLAVPISIAVPNLWDAKIYMANTPLFWGKELSAQFMHLKGWGAEPLNGLGKSYDVLIHNRFLLAPGWKRPSVDASMIAPLYNYKGYFLFVRRNYVEKILDDQDYLDSLNFKESNVRALKRFLSSTYSLFTTSLKITELRDEKAQFALMDHAKARIGYLPGTDIEKAVELIYDNAVSESQLKGPTWEKRNINNDKAWQQAKTNSSFEGLYEELYEDFKKGEYDLFCGGLSHLWDIALNAKDSPDYLVINDPRLLDIHSINGLITTAKIESGKGDVLARLITAFYETNTLLKDTLRKIYIETDDDKIIMSQSVAQCLHAYCVAEPTAFTETDVPTVLKHAWAWLRLLFEYVEYFSNPGEANFAVFNPDSKSYAGDLYMLASKFNEDGI